MHVIKSLRCQANIGYCPVAIVDNEFYHINETIFTRLGPRKNETRPKAIQWRHVQNMLLPQLVFTRRVV